MSEEKREERTWFRIDVNAYHEIVDRIRHPLWVVRDDLQRKKITRTTHQHIEKIFNFLEELNDDNKWDIQNTEEGQEGKLIKF